MHNYIIKVYITTVSLCNQQLQFEERMYLSKELVLTCLMMTWKCWNI